MKVVDMHCDTIYELYERRKKGQKEKLSENDLHIDLSKEIIFYRILLFIRIWNGKRSLWNML